MPRILKVIARSLSIVPALIIVPAAQAAPNAQPAADRGEYLVTIAGCHDCHTPGYAQTPGAISKDKWLVGDTLGWRGPWGTTYPINLRLFLAAMSEEDWVAYARNLRSRPPMPWYQLNKMNEADLRAMYQFIRDLGESGTPAPTYVPPAAEPQTAYISFSPIAPAAMQVK